jgi:hypothetical protein
MVQKVVLNKTPFSFTRLSNEACEWLCENDYELGERLQEDAEYFPDRDDPALIDVVESLDESVVGKSSARLTVVEVPDDVSWVVSSSLNTEEIVEEHRTWSP